MDWFWQKLIKAICYGQNSFVTTKAARKCLFWPKWLYFNKSCSKLCLWAKKALLWQKLFKTVCFYHNGLTSAKATQNCVFCQNSLISAKTHRPNESKWQTGLKRSPGKLYKTLFLGHAQHVLAKSHFWASKLSKSSHWPEILFKTGKQCAFHKICTKRSF